MKKLLPFKRLGSIFLFFYVLTMSSLCAQEKSQTITGSVVDEETNMPVPGVSILVKDTNRGTVTDIDGNFSIQASDKEILIFSFIGYAAHQETVNSRTKIDVSLTPDSQQLSEVVVVGYGTQRKSHVTGAVGKVENKNLDKMPVNNIDQALAGKVAGLQISNTDAEAGASQTIQVRGISSINAGNGPLIVIDGYPVPTSDLSVVDPNDIESIEVLKDAASTAIYGSRGANGVIMITTKSGNVGSPKFNIKSQIGVKSLYSNNDIYPTPSEWASYVNSNLQEMGLSETPDKITEMLNLGTSTDWEDVITRNGIIQNHRLSVRGGNSVVKYYVSGSYLKDEGIYIRNDYEKYYLRLNLDVKLNEHLEMGLIFSPSMVKQTDIPLRFHDAMRAAAWLPVYHDERTVGYAHAAGYTDIRIGDYAHEAHFDNVNGVRLANSSNNNSYAKIAETDISKNYLNNYANAFLKINVNENFNIKSSFGAFTRVYQRDYFRKEQGHRTGDIVGQYQNQRTLNFLNENIANYTRKFGNHHIDAIAGFTFQKWFRENIDLNSDGYLSDDIPTFNAATNVTVDKSNTYDSEESLVSTLFRLNYDYKGKYLASFVTRWDASSRFGDNNKWGFFPSASVGWRVSEENFMQEIPLISNLKLRGSYGLTGNNGINDYEAIASLAPNNAVLGGQVNQGLAQSSPGNPEISWERTFEFNLGLDLGILSNRIQLSMNYYNSHTENLLLLKQIPAVTGFQTVRVNQGELKNEGLELELSTVNINNKNFSWKTDFNISGNRNEVVDFGGVNEIISTPDEKRPSQYITRPGQPLVQYYGYVSADEIPLSELQSPYWPLNIGHESIYVKDLTGDGVIDSDDRTVLGNPYPDFIWGMTNSFTYKNFDLSFVLQGSHGAEVYNIDDYYYHTHWRGQNNLTDAEQAQTRMQLETDKFVQDASFIALRNINLGYNLPKNFIKNTRMSVFLSAQNLWFKFADDYTSYNPEGVNQYTDNPLTYGYQRGATPFARTYSLGIDLSF